MEYNSANVIAILEEVGKAPSDRVESETVEFKEYSSEKALYNDSELNVEICALANWIGGVIIVGVRDTSNLNGKNWVEQLVGFEKIDTVEAEKRIKGRFQNSISIRLENVAFKGKNYLGIFVQKNRDFLATTTSGKICIRDGRDSRPMTPEEIEKAVKSLQNYDWSSDLLEGVMISSLDDQSVEAALASYTENKKLGDDLTKEKLLETIEVTKNGVLTKGGLLFLGRTEAIRELLGDFEFRFSWKEGIELKINEVWSSNLWTAVKKANDLFQQCVVRQTFDYQGNTYSVPNLDPLAFHEAFVNAAVHRDYSKGGMISIEFTGKEMTVSSPGGFYGGVNAENIAVHEPRHRNRALARILMAYSLVDRAGMGVFRMGIQSLVYGRSFPAFEELSDTVRVSMDAEFYRTGIFVLTQGKQRLYVSDLVLLNSLYGRGYLAVEEGIKLIRKVTKDSLQSIIDCCERWGPFVELSGSKQGIFLKVKESGMGFFELSKLFRPPANSEKFVKLFTFLKEHKDASNEDLSNLLNFSQSSSTSRFLSDIAWVERSGRGSSSKWELTKRYA